MINNNDFKYIFKRVITSLIIAFILFNINKCNVSALVYKNAEWYNLDNSIKSGNLTGVSNGAIVTINLKHNVSNYDYLAYKLERYNFTTNPVLINTDIVHYCNVYGEALGNSPVQHTIYQCESTSSDTLHNYDFPSVDYTFSAVIVNQNGAGSGCFFDSSFEGYLICPTNRLEGYADHITIQISYNGYNSSTTLHYYFSLGQTVNYLNDDSTEIVNGLTGVQQQQVQTTQAIEDLTSNINDNNISGANNNTNSALNNIDNSVSNTLDSSISANQLNSILTNFTNQLSNTTCTPITLPIPYTNENIVLPCLGTEFSQRIPVIWALYELIITGVIVLRFWQHGVEFVLNVLDPYHIGANNVPAGGGK